MEEHGNDEFYAVRRKVAWMFFALWMVVLVLTAMRYATHGDMAVTLLVAAAAAGISLWRLWHAYRSPR